jgi:hypothetical protein
MDKSEFSITLSFPKKPETPSEIVQAIERLIKSFEDPPLPKFNPKDFSDLTQHTNHVFFTDSDQTEIQNQIKISLMKSILEKQPNFNGFQLSSCAHTESNLFKNMFPVQFSSIHSADLLQYCKSGIIQSNGKGFLAMINMRIPNDITHKLLAFDQTNFITFQGFDPQCYDLLVQSTKKWCLYVPVSYPFILNFIPNYADLKKKATDAGFTHIVLTNQQTYFF